MTLVQHKRERLTHDSLQMSASHNTIKSSTNGWNQILMHVIFIFFDLHKLVLFSANKSGHYPLIMHSLSNMSKPLNLVMMSPKYLQTLAFFMILDTDTDTVLKSLLCSISEGPLTIYLGPTPVHKVQFEKHCCKTPLKTSYTANKWEKLTSHLHFEYMLTLSQWSSCLYHTQLVYAEGACLFTL